MNSAGNLRLSPILHLVFNAQVDNNLPKTSILQTNFIHKFYLVLPNRNELKAV